MRNLITTLFFLAIIPFVSKGQTQDSLLIPEKVMEAFVERFQDTSKVQWQELEKSFRAEFLNLGDPFIAQFSKKGKWLSSKETIMRRQVEDDLIDAVEEAYPEFGLERFFRNKTVKNEEYIVFELKSGETTIFVRNFDGGFIEVE